ncbi:MAG: TadA family conjugal transfer-associated ATPase [Actinomycetota bacterium]
MIDHQLVDSVRRRLAGRDGRDLAELVRSEAAVHSVLADDGALAAIERTVSAELSGAGPLEPLLALPGITDVLVNNPRDVWLDRGRGLERASVHFSDDASVRRLAQRLAAVAGRRLDDAAPFVDARLPDGTRLHAVLPPLSEWTTLSLRVLARRRFGLDELVPGHVADLLRAVVEARLAFVVTGGTGSGKTTLLGALLACVPADQRLVVVEDAAELIIAHPHVVRLVTRPANVEGSGAVGLRELVRQALRMRPDRLVVGEFRGAEMAELLAALNTGHEGGAATLHANTATDVPSRLSALGALAGVPREAVASQAASGLDLVVHLRRSRLGIRELVQIGVVQLAGSLLVTPVWSAQDGCVGTVLADLLRSRDVPVPSALR